MRNMFFPRSLSLACFSRYLQILLGLPRLLHLYLCLKTGLINNVARRSHAPDTCLRAMLLMMQQFSSSHYTASFHFRFFEGLFQRYQKIILLCHIWGPHGSDCGDYRLLGRGGVWGLTLRRLMSYIYGAPILDVSRSHTTTQHSR